MNGIKDRSSPKMEDFTEYIVVSKTTDLATKVRVLRQLILYCVAHGVTRNEILASIEGTDEKSTISQDIDLAYNKLGTISANLSRKSFMMDTDDLYFIDEDLAGGNGRQSQQHIYRSPQLQKTAIGVTEQLLMSGRSANVIGTSKM